MKKNAVHTGSFDTFCSRKLKFYSTKNRRSLVVGLPQPMVLMPNGCLSLVTVDHGDQRRTRTNATTSQLMSVCVMSCGEGREGGKAEGRTEGFFVTVRGNGSQ